MISSAANHAVDGRLDDRMLEYSSKPESIFGVGEKKCVPAMIYTYLISVEVAWGTGAAHALHDAGRVLSVGWVADANVSTALGHDDTEEETGVKAQLVGEVDERDAQARGSTMGGVNSDGVVQAVPLLSQLVRDGTGSVSVKSVDNGEKRLTMVSKPTHSPAGG